MNSIWVPIINVKAIKDKMTTYNKALPLKIYGPSFSNFVRSIMLICEERGLDYQTGFDCTGEKIEFKSAAHLALHPYGKFPILFHGELVLPETASICRYIINLVGNQSESELSPTQLARIDAFGAITSIYLDKAIMRDYILEFAFPKGEGGEVRLEVAIAAQSEVRKALQLVNSELLQGEILLAAKGASQSLTLADALIAPMLHYISTLHPSFNLLSDFPAIEKYLAELMRRESCKKVLVRK